MTDNLTPYQAIARAQRLTGKKQIRPKPYETLVKWVFQPTRITLVFETYRYKENTYRTTFSKRGLRMVSFHSVPNPQRWIVDPEIIVWEEEDFEPFQLFIKGNLWLEQSHQQQTEWERDCARPGTSRTPLDSYDRTYIAPDTPWDDPTVKSSPAMLKHWR